MAGTSTSTSGSSGADELTALDSGSKISAGAGDDTLTGGSGSDRLNGDAGDDTFIYNVTRSSAGSVDIYTGGSGIDTVLIEFTRAQWLDPAIQQQITDYLAHLAAVTNKTTLQVSNALSSDFTFTFGSATLTLQMMEQLRVRVDGVELDPANALVAATGDSAGVSEDGPSTDIYVLANDTVPDLVKELAMVSGPVHGTATLVKYNAGDPATWCFKYEPDTAHCQYLADGETATDTFIYCVTDANGDTSEATVTVTITGSNDGPTISAAVAARSINEDADPEELAATGTIAFDDPDSSDSHSVSVAPHDGNTLGGSLIASITTAATGPGSGTVTWNYKVSNAVVQSLALNETVKESFTVVIDDGHGGSVSQEVTVTVVGTNDRPEITNTAEQLAGAVQEDTQLTASGQLSASDVDHGATQTWSVQGNASGTYGSIAVDANGKWTYTLDNGAHQNLSADESHDELFTVRVTDDHGAYVDQVVTVTVSGSNDTPTVIAALSQNGDEGSSAFALDLLAGASDPDHGETASLAVANVTYSVDGSAASATPPAGVSRSGATLSVDPADPAFEYLALGESQTIVIAYAVRDVHGDAIAQICTLTITGTNDAPFISAATATGSVTEDASPVTLSTTGTIVFDDLDLTDAHSTSVAPSSGNTLGGSLTATVTQAAGGSGSGTVTWTYTVSNAVVQSLNTGETRTESFTVTISDGQGGTVEQTVTVTIVGANEPGPVGGADNIITNVAVGTSFEVPEWALLANDTLSGGGTLDISGVSSLTGLTATHAGGSGSTGTVTIIDSLPAGGSFSYTPTDDNGAGAATLATVSRDASGGVDGTSGRDILVSGSTGATFNGGQGDDIELGGTSNDIYLFGLNDGKDTIADSGGGNDAIQITTSSPSDDVASLNFEMVGADLVIKVGATEITIKNHFSSGTTEVESITFTNGGNFSGYAIGTNAYRIGSDPVDLSGNGNQMDVIASSVAGQALTGGGGNDLLFGNGGSDNILGDNGSDLLVAGDGNDSLAGGQGNDWLQGGSGADAFVFNTTLNGSSNVDRVLDFDASVDRISLSSAIFSALGAGPLAASDFSMVNGNGTSASVGAGVNIIYDSLNGNLYYDADGGTSANRTLFATATIVGGTFDNGDFQVV